MAGAGGGGCAITLVPSDFPESTLSDLIEALRQDGFVPYLTSVGGPGLGIMQTKVHARDGVAPAAAEPSHVPAGRLFRDIPAAELAEWAVKSGHWVHT